MINAVSGYFLGKTSVLVIALSDILSGCPIGGEIAWLIPWHGVSNDKEWFGPGLSLTGSASLPHPRELSRS